MDHIVRYRDLPWSVAAGAFFGKLGWTCIKPFNVSKRVWRKRLVKMIRIILFILLFVVLTITIDHFITGGRVVKAILGA
jgi:hypothetical protein